MSGTIKTVLLGAVAGALGMYLYNTFMTKA